MSKHTEGPYDFNALLREAAPDLYCAVLGLLMGPAHPDWPKHVEQARAAIAKAEGK